MGETIDAKVLDQKLEALINSPGGWNKIAQQMQSPIKYDLLYEGRARQLFRVHQLAQGEPAIFDRDIRVPSVKLAKRGLPNVLIVESDRVEVDTFEIATRPEVRYEELVYRRFDVLNRAQERAKSQIMEIEDQQAFSVIDTASTLVNSAITESDTYGRITLANLAQAFTAIESRRLIPVTILMHPCHLADFRTLNSASAYRIFDEVTLYEVLKTGKFGKIWNANVMTSVLVNPAKMYVLAAPEFTGVMPIRMDVTVKPFDDTKKLAVTFTCFENIGFSVIYSHGIVQIDFSGTPASGAWPSYGPTG